MNDLSKYLRDRYYSSSAHPYRIFDKRVGDIVAAGGVSVLMDAGCGRTVPLLRKYLGRVDRLIGVELETLTDVPSGIEVHNADLASLPLQDASVDLIMSRSVFEHLNDPDAVYREFARVLRPGGRIVFLTANLWDYATLVARLIPNRFHARIVRLVEGRHEEDTFPTFYRTNTRRVIHRQASRAGLRVEEFEYLGQYPNYLMFSGVLFLIGTAYDKLICRFAVLRFLRSWLLVTLEKPKS